MLSSQATVRPRRLTAYCELSTVMPLIYCPIPRCRSSIYSHIESEHELGEGLRFYFDPT